MLDLSQIEAGQMALMRERAALGEIVDEAVTAVRPLFNSKGLSLRQDIPLNLPKLHCDRIRIRQVLLNLLSNAGRFTERGGVQICARLEEEAIIVSVADTGPGIKALMKWTRSSNPFSRVDGSIHSHWTGSGLGLEHQQAFCGAAQGTDVAGKRARDGARPFIFGCPWKKPSQRQVDGMMRWFSPYSTYVERTSYSVASRDR